MAQTTTLFSNSNSTTSTMLQEKVPSLVRIRTPPTDVRTVDWSESDEAAQCLIEAFATDEIARYFLDTPDSNRTVDEKWSQHVTIMRAVTAAHCHAGLVTTAGPNHAAVALWMPPGAGDIDGWWTTLRSGLWRLKWCLSREGASRFYEEFMPLLHDTKHEVLGERDPDSYYLVYLGTKPEARGKGYAGMLIDDMAKKADAEGRAMYLESSAESNIPYYSRRGFSLRKDITLTRAEKPLKLGVMVREPCMPGETSKREA